MQVRRPRVQRRDDERPPRPTRKRLPLQDGPLRGPGNPCLFYVRLG